MIMHSASPNVFRRNIYDYEPNAVNHLYTNTAKTCYNYGSNSSFHSSGRVEQSVFGDSSYSTYEIPASANTRGSLFPSQSPYNGCSYQEGIKQQQQPYNMFREASYNRSNLRSNCSGQCCTRMTYNCCYNCGAPNPYEYNTKQMTETKQSSDISDDLFDLLLYVRLLPQNIYFWIQQMFHEVFVVFPPKLFQSFRTCLWTMLLCAVVFTRLLVEIVFAVACAIVETLYLKFVDEMEPQHWFLVRLFLAILRPLFFKIFRPLFLTILRPLFWTIVVYSVALQVQFVSLQAIWFYRTMKVLIGERVERLDGLFMNLEDWTESVYLWLEFIIEEQQL